MKKSACLLLFLAAPAFAADPVAKLSGPARVDVGQAIVLNPADSVATGLEFGLASGPGPAPVVTLKSDDGKTVIGFGTAATPGVYTFFCVAWGDAATPPARQAHSFAFCVVTVGDPTPVPPPVPPPISDPLLAPLAAAYSADGSPSVPVRNLASVYRVAADGRLAFKATITTTADLLAQTKAAAELMVPAGQLPAVRKAVAAELVAKLGATPAPLTDASRQLATDTFGRIATLLDTVASK